MGRSPSQTQSDLLCPITLGCRYREMYAFAFPASPGLSSDGPSSRVEASRKCAEGRGSDIRRCCAERRLRINPESGSSVRFSRKSAVLGGIRRIPLLLTLFPSSSRFIADSSASVPIDRPVERLESGKQLDAEGGTHTQKRNLSPDQGAPRQGSVCCTRCVFGRDAAEQFLERIESK